MRIDLGDRAVPSPAPVPVRAHRIRESKRRVIRISRRVSRARQVGGPAFNELLQNIYDGVLLTTLDGGIISANQRAMLFFGCQLDDICAVNVVDILSGADARLLPTVLRNLENDQFTLIQGYMIRKDGSSFPCEISVNRMQIDEEDYLIFFIRDITLRKQQEDQLQTGYSALQNSGSGIAVTDLEGRLAYANPALRRLWALGPDEATEDLSLLDFLPGKEYLERVIAAVRSGAAWSGELTMQPRGREPIHVRASVMANVNVDDEITGLVFSLMDVTEEKRAKQQLENYARELREKNRQMEHDLAMAREIQLAFLPSHYPVVPAGALPKDRALEFAHLYIPGGKIGGDFFDLLTLKGGKIGLLMADVSGHGVRSALVVATLRGLVEQLMDVAEEPALFLQALNKAYTSIFTLGNDYTFVTVFYGVLDPATGGLCYSNAGHPCPYLLKEASGTALELSYPGECPCPAVGMVGDSRFGESRVSMHPGDVLLLYTDGIHEQENAAQAEFGGEGLQHSLQRLRSKPPHALLQDLVAEVRAFMGKGDFDDDVCLLAVKFRQCTRTAASQPDQGT